MDHGPLAGARRGRRLGRAHRVRGLPGAARLRRAGLGRADPARAAGRGERRRQGRRPPGRRCSPTTGPRSWWPTPTARPSRACAPSGQGSRRSSRTRSPAWSSTRTRPAPSAARSPTTWWRRLSGASRGGRGQQPARAPRRRGSARRARGALRPGLPGQLRRGDPGGRRAARLLDGAGPGAHGPRPRHHPRGAGDRRRPRGCCRSPPPSGWPRRGSPRARGMRAPPPSGYPDARDFQPVGIHRDQL